MDRLTETSFLLHCPPSIFFQGPCPAASLYNLKRKYSSQSHSFTRVPYCHMENVPKMQTCDNTGQLRILMWHRAGEEVCLCPSPSISHHSPTAAEQMTPSLLMCLDHSVVPPHLASSSLPPMPFSVRPSRLPALLRTSCPSLPSYNSSYTLTHPQSSLDTEQTRAKEARVPCEFCQLAQCMVQGRVNDCLLMGPFLMPLTGKTALTPVARASCFPVPPPTENDSQPGFQASDLISHLITLAKNQLLKHT